MKTRDFGLISALRCLGHRELHVDDSNPERIVFEFDDEVNSLADEYYEMKLTVSAKEYYESLRDVKDLLWHVRNRVPSKMEYR